jgi:hypothetical protein
MGIEGGEHGYARSREVEGAILIDR